MRILSNLAFIVLLLLFGSFVSIYSQTVVENPVKAANSKSGRIVELKEVMRITDESGEYYFKSPRLIKVALNGSIFYLDRDEFLQFDESGKLIRNLFKKGQGPMRCRV